MADDVFSHISSNSNQSDPSLPLKIAKLEARMAGKPSSASAQGNWQGSQCITAVPSTGQSALSSSSDSGDDDDGGERFLIRPNPMKRKTYEDREEIMSHQVETDGKRHVDEDLSQKSLTYFDDKNSKRGKGNGIQERTGKGKEYFSSHSEDIINCQPDNVTMKEYESLKAKSSSLEEELQRVRQDLSDCQQSNRLFEKELIDFREQEQQREQKRMKAMSELLIAVANSERQEARMRMRQNIVRLGNVSVVRAGTVITEGWEDGQAFKDIQLQQRSLLDQREALEKHRKLLRKGKTESILQ